jgi:Emfourin
MRIVFRQSGGLLGTPREFDTANLAEPAGREADELLKRAGIHGSLNQTSGKARDATRYELTITDGNKTTRIVTDDATVSSQLLPLIEFLREHSRPVPLKQRGARD